MIQVERVYKSFSEPALRGCSLRVEKGQMLGLVGPPGAGKSVLLRAIAGLVTPDAGSIRHFGEEIVHSSHLDRRRIQSKVGMLFQNVALFDFLSVGDNLRFVLRQVDGLSPAEIEQRVQQELSAVGLSDFARRDPRELSGGQRRRIGIARAAIARPQVLLYDEPAAGLDPVTTARAFRLLRTQISRLNAVMIVVSSDIDRLLPAVDVTAVMMAGRIVAAGTQRKLLSCENTAVRSFLEGRSDA